MTWTPDAVQARLTGRGRLTEVTLFTISLMGGGPTIYASDRLIKVGTQWFLPLIKTWSGLSSRAERLTSKAVNPDIRIEFLNRRYASYTRLSEIDATYPFTFAPVTIQRIYLDDDGTQSNARTRFVGRLDGIDKEDVETFTCGASHLSLYLAKKKVQETVSLAVFPGADPDAVGKPMPENVGAIAGVPCLATDAGAVTTIAANMTASQNTADLTEAQGETPFLSSGSAYVDQEKITWTGKTGKQLTGVSRGQSGTTAVEHDKGAKIGVVQSAYSYLAMRDKMKTITGVLVDDVRQSSGFTAYTGKTGDEHPDAAYAGRAAVKFTVKPTLVKQVNMGVDTGGGDHSHGAGIQTEQMGTGGSHYPTTGITWAGSDSNMYDGDRAYGYLIGSSTNWPGGNRFRVTFPAWTGGTITNVKIRLTYAKYLVTSGTASFDGHALSDSTDPYTVIFDNGADYSAQLDVVVSTGANMYLKVYEIDQIVTSDTASANAEVTATLSGNSTAETVIGREVTIEGEGYQDNASGTYSGMANALLKNPAHLIKYLLMAWGGLTSGEIGSSFASTATSLTNAGYEFAFQWTDLLKSLRDESGPTFPEWIEDLAFQAGCIFLWGADGKAELIFIPRATPAATVTIKESDTDDGFKFGRTAEQDINNDWQAVYDKVYSGEKAGTWAGDKTDSDSASQTKYGGVFHKRYELWAVRNAAMVTDWLTFRKGHEKDRLITVDFDVWWREGKKLEPGDTFDITASLHNGTKFWAISVEEVDDGFYAVEGLSWP